MEYVFDGGVEMLSIFCLLFMLCEIYLVGIVYVSEWSVREVREFIRLVKSSVVYVEFCE